MHTLAEIAKTLNRSTVYIHGLQQRFELPSFEGAAYSDAYLAFLRTIVFLRVLNVSEEVLREIWHLEKKLLQLLHVDSIGSKTWFLDACGLTVNRDRRLLLSNHDLGVALPDGSVQLGLDFSASLPELFSGKEMGEDVQRVLRDYLKLYTRIRSELSDEISLVRSAASWAGRLR